MAGSDDDPAAGTLRHREGVDLMPSNIELAAMEMAVFMAMSRERMMGAWLAPIKAGYDYVIVDCAPTLGIIPINALAAADSVLIPVSAEHLPASGMTGLLKTVVRVRRQIRAGAAELADLAEVPCIVREMTEGEAIIAMVDSNLQRESILPSEAPSRTP